MQLKRSLISGIILWVLIFFEVSILMFGFKLEGTPFYTAHYIILAILVVIVGLYYFKDKKVARGLKEGLLAGVIFVIVGLILDAVITVPLFVKDYGFFLELTLLIGIIEIILITGIIGAIRK